MWTVYFPISNLINETDNETPGSQAWLLAGMIYSLDPWQLKSCRTEYQARPSGFRNTDTDDQGFTAVSHSSCIGIIIFN